jgi:hypothetical protein
MRCYTSYVETPENRYEELKTAQIRECQTRLQCDLNKTEGLCICRTTIEEVAEERGLGVRQVRDLYFEACNPRGIGSCWGENEDITLQRSRCEIILGNANYEIPEIQSNSCLDGNN